MNCFIIRLHLLNQINVFWGDQQKRVSFVSLKDATFSLCQLFTSEKQFASGVNSLSLNITLLRNNRDCTVLNKMEIRRVALCTQMSLLMFALIHVYRLILCLQSGNLRLINLRCANLKSPCQAVHWLSFGEPFLVIVIVQIIIVCFHCSKKKKKLRVFPSHLAT